MSKAAPVTMIVFHLPKRLISCPDPTDAMSIPATSGMDSTPATVGVKPRAVWKYWPRKVVEPTIPIPHDRYMKCLL